MTATIIVSTPDLRPSLFSVLQGLAADGLLARVATTISFTGSQIQFLSNLPLFGRKLRPMVSRRQLPSFLASKVDNIWSRELVRYASSRFASPAATHALWKWAETNFDRIVAERYGGRFDVVYGMEHSSAKTFAAQRAGGGRSVLRQVAAHARVVQTVLERETKCFPHLVTSYHRLLLQEAEKIAERKEVEYGLADLIVTNSDYVRSTFIAHGIPENRLISVPSGCPPVDSVGARSGAGKEPMRLLYAGVLSLRKGFPYLLEAWRKLKPGTHAELWIAGSAEIDILDTLRKERGIRYLGALRKDELCDVYRQVDILVMPTLCEGLAHVVLEALSFGLPIITTEASGAGNLVISGENGLIVPEADDSALAEAMQQALALRTELPLMGARSADRARSWTVADSNAEHLRRISAFLEERS